MVAVTFLGERIEMEDDDEYQRQLDLFVRSSDEKPRVLALLRRLITRLPRHDDFLDVGAGAGDLAVPLSHYFSRTTVVEPNPLQAARLAEFCPDLQVVNASVLDLDLSGWGFDLVLCSHVLYYLPEARWLAIVQKMHDWLSPGGMAVIILQSPAGEMAEFFGHFTGCQVPVIPLWDALVTRFGE